MNNRVTREKSKVMAEDCLIFLANEIRRFRINAYLDGLIDKNEFHEYSDWEKECRDCADELIVSKMNDIVTDIDEPINRLVVATRKISYYLNRVESMRKIIPEMTKFISILVKISTAIMSGNPLVSIASQIGELEKMIKES